MGAQLEAKGTADTALAAYKQGCSQRSTFVEPCVHAAALQIASDPNAAWALISQALPLDPLGVYARVAGDRRLEPLLARHELAAMRDPRAGEARLSEANVSQGRNSGFIAYSKKHDAVAVLGNQLFVYAADSGRMMTVIRLQPGPDFEFWSREEYECAQGPDYARCRKAERKAARVEQERWARTFAMIPGVNAWLLDLGFSPPTDVEPGNLEFSWDTEINFRRFPIHHTHLSAGRGVLRVRRDQQVVFETKVEDSFCLKNTGGWLSLSTGVLITEWEQNSGNDDYPYHYAFTVLPIRGQGTTGERLPDR